MLRCFGRLSNHKLSNHRLSDQTISVAEPVVAELAEASKRLAEPEKNI